MVSGAVVNAAAFIGGNYLARALGGGGKAERGFMIKLSRRIKRITPNTPETAPNLSTGLRQTRRKAEAKQNFTNTDYAFKLFNQAHPDERMTPPKELKFSDFYQPSEQQKQGELVLGISMPWRCFCLLASGRLPESKGYPTLLPL